MAAILLRHWMSRSPQAKVRDNVHQHIPHSHDRGAMTRPTLRCDQEPLTVGAESSEENIIAGQADLGFEVSSSLSLKTITFVLTILKGKRTVCDVPQPMCLTSVFSTKIILGLYYFFKIFDLRDHIFIAISI